MQPKDSSFWHYLIHYRGRALLLIFFLKNDSFYLFTIRVMLTLRGHLRSSRALVF